MGVVREFRNFLPLIGTKKSKFIPKNGYISPLSLNSIGGEGDDTLFGIDRHVEIGQEVSAQQAIGPF
jgi:hypothetical protein